MTASGRDALNAANQPLRRASSSAAACCSRYCFAHAVNTARSAPAVRILAIPRTNWRSDAESRRDAASMRRCSGYWARANHAAAPMRPPPAATPNQPRNAS